MPLLEFALEELYTRCSQVEEHPQLLTFAAYEAMGGLNGAIARRAEAVFAKFVRPGAGNGPGSGPGQYGQPGSGGKRILERKRIPYDQVAATPASRELIDAFVAARLMVADRSDDGGTVVGLAHEALLQHWGKARAWVEENRDFLRIRTRIATAAALWQGQEELPSLLLPPGKPLAAAEKLLARQRGKLGDDEIRYIETSLQEAQRKKRGRALWRGAWAAALFCLILGGLWYWDAHYRIHYEYYLNMTKRWSSPEGIGPLSAAQAGHRSVSYQFLAPGEKRFYNRSPSGQWLWRACPLA